VLIVNITDVRRESMHLGHLGLCVATVVYAVTTTVSLCC